MAREAVEAGLQPLVGVAGAFAISASNARADHRHQEGERREGDDDDVGRMASELSLEVVLGAGGMRVERPCRDFDGGAGCVAKRLL